MATIFVVTCLLLLKGNNSKRVYKHWLIDTLENAIYFNSIIFAVLTWYCLNPGTQVNQNAITCTSIAVIFILFITVVIFHTLRYTKLYNCPCVRKLFVKLSSKLYGQEETDNDTPKEPDGPQPERAVKTTVTHTVIELQETLLKS